MDSRSGPPALIWRSTALRLVIAAFPLWSATAVLTFHTTWPLQIAVAALALLTLAAPAAGLCALAVLTPLALALAGALQLSGYRMSEMFVMTFLGAWLLRAGSDRSGPRLPAIMTAAGWLLAVASATSVASLAWRMREFPADLADTVARLWGAYFLFPDRIGFIDGARMLEGLGLVAATLYVLRRSPSIAIRLPAALCAGGALASLLSVLIWRGTGPAILVDAFGRLGRAAHIFDVNAAGSYFAMTLCLAVGMTARARTTSPRAAWVGLAVMNGVGLWLSDSRSATAAIVITAMLACVWLVTAGWSVRARAATLAVVIVVGLTGSFVRARLLERDPNFRGGGFRQQFYVTSLRMIAARPLSGVGIGQYARASALFLPPQLAWSYGSENAHNYFLQVGAELGIPGLVFFVIWIGAALAPAARSLARGGDPRLLGATVGTCAFLATCATGHPLLVNEVAFPFWIQFGLTLGLALSPLVAFSNEATGLDDHRTGAPGSRAFRADLRRWLNGVRTRPPAVRGESPASHRMPADFRRELLWALTACVACFVVAVGIASAAAGPVQPPASQAIDGFYPWETAEDGRRVRWTGGYGSLFVPAEIARVYIPVRVPVDRPAIAPMPIDIAISGQRRGPVLVGSNWGTLDLWLPQVAPPVRFKRIDLRVERTWQPALYVAGSYDMRAVGIQVGECELVR